MSEEDKKPEGSGSGQTGDSNSDTSRQPQQQQSDDARRSNSMGAGGGGERSSSGGGGGANRQGSRRRHRGEREGQPAPRRTETSINMDELRELADLITTQGFTEFELEKEGFRLRLSRNTYSQTPAGAPNSSTTGSIIPFPAPPAPTTTSSLPTQSHAATGAAPPAAEAAAAPGVAEDLHKITSPIVGTFYRAPSPTSDVFISQGSRVGPESVVCIIEAMKLMNEIQAEVSGTIEKIYVENGQPVEYGQALFGVKK